MKYYKYVVVPLGVPTNFCYCYWIRLPGQETRDMGLMPWSGRAPGEGNGNPLQYSCLENSMDKGAWWATVHGVAKSWYGWAHTHSMWLVVVWCYSLSCLRLFATPWITALQTSLSITRSQSSPKLMSIELVMPSSHLILCRPLLLLPPIPPSIRVFSNPGSGVEF